MKKYLLIAIVVMVWVVALTAKNGAKNGAGRELADTAVEDAAVNDTAVSDAAVSDAGVRDALALFDNEFFRRGDLDGEYQFWLNAAAASPVARDYLREFDRLTLADPQCGDATLAQFAVSPNADLRRLAADYYRQNGEVEKAAAAYQAAGLLVDWQLAGPFGRFGRASFYETFAPETAPETATVRLDQKLPSRDGGSKWQKIAATLPFSPWQWVGGNGVVFLWTEIELSAPTALNIEIVTDSYAQAWFDGAPAATTASPEEMLRGENLAFPVSANAGTHQLLLKLYPSDGGKNEVAAYVSPVPPSAPRVRAVKFNELSTWEAITRRAPNAAAAWARLAQVARRALELPPAKRESVARSADETALKIDPDCVPSLVALAQYDIGKKRFAAAKNRLDRALAKNPQAVAALSAAVNLALFAGWRAEAAAQLTRLRQTHPRSFAAALNTATLAESGRDYQTLFAALRKILRMDATNPARDAQFAQAALLANQIPAALAEWEKPNVFRAAPFFADWGAQLAVAQKEYAAAEKWLEVVPDELAAKWLTLAKIRTLQNRPSAAAQALDRALAIAPDQHSVRRWRDQLTGEKYEFWAATDVAAADALKEFNRQSKPTGRTARLIDQTVLQIYPDGSFANYTHGLQAVLTPGGVGTAAQMLFLGEPIVAETILPEQGITLEPTRLAGQEQFIMPNVAPGVFVHNKFLQTAPANDYRTLQFPQWYFRSPDTEEAFIFSQYVVRAPDTPDAKFTYVARNLTPDIDFQASPEDGGMLYQWTAKNMPRSLHEEGGLSIDETLPFVRVGRQNSWQDLNLMCANYYLGRTMPTPALRAAVAKILGAREERKGNKEQISKREKVARIFAAVCGEVAQTNWLAPAAYIWEQRAGDRNLVLLTMLKIAGLSPRLVAARPPESLLFPAMWELPDLDVFTNFIVAVPDENGGYWWLDARSRFAQAGELGEDLAGGAAMLIDPRAGGELVALPAARPHDYTATERREYDFTGVEPRNGEPRNGEPRLTGEKTWRGNLALALKETLATQNPTGQSNEIERRLSDGLPALTLDRFALTGDGATATITYAATLPDAVSERANGERGAATGLPALGLLPAADFSDRQTPYHLQKFVATDDYFIFKIPATARVASLPPDVSIKNDFGFYQLNFRAVSGAIEVRRRAHFPPQRITLNQWGAFAAMARQIADDENQSIWWSNQE
ncbi:hypothetical protein AGMMS49959_07850 [Planctomycetales bacterium]|nr:hypothetical protein AGMMS49959_07850 [Planctomycetales bacterium]